MKEEKYCGVCGLKLIQTDIIGYDIVTGKPIKYKECPSKKCGHTGIYHRWKSFLEPIDSFGQEMCISCGIKRCIKI